MHKTEGGVVHTKYPLSIYFDSTVKNSEYDQEIPQSQTPDNPMAPRGRAT